MSCGLLKDQVQWQRLEITITVTSIIGRTEIVLPRAMKWGWLQSGRIKRVLTVEGGLSEQRSMQTPGCTVRQWAVQDVGQIEVPELEG